MEGCNGISISQFVSASRAMRELEKDWRMNLIYRQLQRMFLYKALKKRPTLLLLPRKVITYPCELLKIVSQTTTTARFYQDYVGTKNLNKRQRSKSFNTAVNRTILSTRALIKSIRPFKLRIVLILEIPEPNTLPQSFSKTWFNTSIITQLSQFNSIIESIYNTLNL